MSLYNKGKIYKVLNILDNEVYVGSTTQTLSKRLSEHKIRTNDTTRHHKLNEHMRSLGIDNFYIELIENYPCNTKEELCAKEGEWIRSIGTINKIIHGRTIKEWRHDNKDKIQEYRLQRKDIEKQYRKDNKDKIKAYRDTYKANHKDAMEAYHKQYREDNKDNKQKYDKQYKEANGQYLKEKIICDNCGCTISRNGMTSHKKTQKCMNHNK